MKFRKIINKIQKSFSDTIIKSNELIIIKFKNKPNLSVVFDKEKGLLKLQQDYSQQMINVLNMNILCNWFLDELSQIKVFSREIFFCQITKSKSLIAHINDFLEYTDSEIHGKLNYIRSFTKVQIVEQTLNRIMNYRYSQDFQYSLSYVEKRSNNVYILSLRNPLIRSAILYLESRKEEDDVLLRIESLSYFISNESYNKNIELLIKDNVYPYAIYERNKFIFQANLNEILATGKIIYDFIDSYYKASCEIVEKINTLK